MGNCINLSFSRAEKAEILIFSEGEKEFRASKLVKEFTSGPYQAQPHDHSISLRIIKNESCRGRTIKIVITRQQLEFLLRDAKMFQSKKITVRSKGKFNRWDRKWQPSLSAIPEVPGL